MKIQLTIDEERVYRIKFLSVVPNLMPGTYNIKYFFDPDPSVPRISRKFYEDVVNGRFPNISLAGSCSREGYVVI